MLQQYMFPCPGYFPCAPDRAVQVEQWMGLRGHRHGRGLGRHGKQRRTQVHQE